MRFQISMKLDSENYKSVRVEIAKILRAFAEGIEEEGVSFTSPQPLYDGHVSRVGDAVWEEES